MSSLGPWRLEKESLTLSKGAEKIILKPIEWRLLSHFVAHPTQAFRIHELKIDVWQQEYLSDSAVKKSNVRVEKSPKRKNC